MTNEFVHNIKELIEEKASVLLQEKLSKMHPADIAELCDELSEEEARFLYRQLDNEKAADALTEMDEDLRNDLLEDLFQLVDDDGIRFVTDILVPTDQSDLHIPSIGLQVLVHPDGSEESVDVGILRVGYSECRSCLHTVVYTYYGCDHSCLDPEVIVPVHRKDQGLFVLHIDINGNDGFNS